MSNLTQSNKRIYITLGILGALMLLIVFGIYPKNYSNFTRYISTFVEIFIWGSFLMFVFAVIFGKKKIEGEKTVGTIKYFALTATLGIAGLFFAYCVDPSWIESYGVDATPVLMDFFSPHIWALYVPFIFLELFDSRGIFPTWFSEIKRYLYAITMVLAIGISLMAISNTIPTLCKTMFDWEVSPYAAMVLVSALTGISLFRGINKGMGVFSVIAMSLMILISIVLLISSLSGTPMEYAITELTSYFRGLAPRHLDRETDFYIGVIADYSVWSIAWSGIIGKFMVNLSKGRSIRTTVLATVLIPTLVCWTYIFISRYAFGFNQAKYDLLANWPIIGILYIVMVSLMFVTSSDSTAYSIDQEVSRGQKATSNYRKLLWVVVIMVFSTTLLLIGGNTGDALYALDYIACPILAILCIVGLCMGFYKSIKEYNWNSLKLKFNNILHKK